MANEVVYKILADTRQYVNQMKPAIRSGQQLEEQNKDLEKIGVRTSAAFRKELIELERLTREYKNDSLAVAQLTARKKQLVAEMNRLSATTTANTSRMGGLTAGVGALKGAWVAALAVPVVQFLGDITRAGIEQQQALAGVQSSITAAQREFGGIIGTGEEWQGVQDELVARYGLTEAATATATARTIDMTKRLGLNAVQMEVLLKRTAALSIGKTDLAGGIERTSAALRGEAESAEFLALTLNQDFINQQALARGLEKDLIPKLTEAEKAQIRLLETIVQSSEVYANVDELLDTQAATVQRLTARWENLKAQMGVGVLQALELSGAFDILEGKVTKTEGALATMLFTIPAFGPILAGMVTRLDDGEEAVEGLDTAFQDFQKTIEAVSPKVAEAIDEEAFRAAEAAGTLLEFRRDQLQKASDELIQRIRKAARERADAGNKQKTILDKQTDSVAQLQKQLSLLRGPESERLALLDLQEQKLKDQVKTLRSLNAERARQAQVGATLDAAGIDGGAGLTPRGLADLDQGATRTRVFRLPDELGGGLQFLRERFETELDAMAAHGEIKLREVGQATESAAAQIMAANEALAQSITDPFERAGLAMEEWLFHTREGAAFFGEIWGETLGGFANLAGAAFEASGKKTEAFFKIQKGFAVAQAIMDTYAAANVALKSAPPPFNYALMAGVIATGIGNVAKILSAEPGSSGTGAGGASSGPAVATEGTQGFTPTFPAGLFQADAAAETGRAGVKLLTDAVAASQQEVVEAINDLDITTELQDDHVMIQVSRAQGQEQDVGVQ